MFMNEHKIFIPVESYLIFVNPHFTLYQAPIGLPIIFPTQLEPFIKKLNDKSVFKVNPLLTKFADKLIANHLPDTHLTQKLHYDYDELRKGVYCHLCDSIKKGYTSSRVSLKCTSCGGEQKVTAAIQRSIEEYQLLFPKKKLTTNGVYNWCGEIISKKVIRKYLIQNLKIKKHGRSTYFE